MSTCIRYLDRLDSIHLKPTFDIKTFQIAKNYWYFDHIIILGKFKKINTGTKEPSVSCVFNLI